MTDLSKPQMRPSSITYICVGWFFGAIFAGQLALSPVSRQIASWYPAYLAIAAVVGIVCTIGLWRMRKWAVYAIAGSVLANLVVLIMIGNLNVLAPLISAVVLYVVFKHRTKMV